MNIGGGTDRPSVTSREACEDLCLSLSPACFGYDFNRNSLACFTFEGEISNNFTPNRDTDHYRRAFTCK